MVEEPIAFLRAEQSSQPARTGSSGGQVAQVRFDRAELDRILTIYGRMVAAGRMARLRHRFSFDVAAFSIFRRASEVALFTIEKRPKLRAKQGHMP
ncbi:MAG: DUF2794 domain-containing protein [Rhizomicrobium sp.]